ncbi:hypothetical protein PFISCL1PPCAC_8006 [Pristionchus fissidentatus]|uniref:FHA domain-containing protein n=1 Tax=Pristionchus fissidentatus TaxID=1538716 RepID=A0AAV5VE33_9BILA|nr:hypothetical protein PFISCL1PPCAC_8006 [Pristionchus fissidentatus]
MYIPSYHLRRVNPKSHHPEELILLGEITKFGRNADNVDVVLTSAVYSNMISRDHAIITGRVDPSTRQIVGYKIRDNSLNGTYINDRRVKDEVPLVESAVIKFGHMNGAAIKAGAEAPQANAEFSFVFEKCSHTRRYIGWEGMERRRTVVCTGDGKPISETGEDHRTKRRPVAKVEPVSSTTTSAPAAQQHPPAQQQQPTAAAAAPNAFAAATSQQEQMHQLLLLQQKQMMAPFGHLGHFPQALIQQQLAAQMRANGQFQNPLATAAAQQSHLNPALRVDDPSPSTSASVPIRSPPVECDSSVPSPPKHNGLESRGGGGGAANHADSSSQHSPRGRGKDDDDDSFSVPDSPPRAPRPHDVPGRSVTNSPAPPSPRPVEKVEKPADPPKEMKKKAAVPKKPANPGKVPKTGGGGEKRSNKEVDRLLTDLTEGSFMMEQRRRLSVGAANDRRKAATEGKKIAKKPKNKMHKQLSSASSDSDSGEEEEERAPARSSAAARPSMVGKKASTSAPKTAMKRNGGVGAIALGRGGGRKEDASDESDPYEESDDDSEGEKKHVKKKTAPERKSAVGKPARKEKPAPAKKKQPKKKPGKRKKDSDDSSGGGSESDEKEEDVDVDVEQEEEEGEGGGEFVDTEQTKCASSLCKTPRGGSVEWVCCDGCEKWFHTFCVLGLNKKFEANKNFFCGCKQSVPTKKKKA